jgi:alkylation response protein AidB-like acyl-CoA dehydrogenase
MAKLKATQTARQVAQAGMQMMGGYGYAREFDMEKHVRSALVCTILGGQRNPTRHHRQDLRLVGQCGICVD